jgi:hypothetical protein
MTRRWTRHAIQTEYRINETMPPHRYGHVP